MSERRRRGSFIFRRKAKQESERESGEGGAERACQVGEVLQGDKARDDARALSPQPVSSSVKFRTWHAPLYAERDGVGEPDRAAKPDGVADRGLSDNEGDLQRREPPPNRPRAKEKEANRTTSGSRTRSRSVSSWWRGTSGTSGDSGRERDASLADTLAEPDGRPTDGDAKDVTGGRSRSGSRLGRKSSGPASAAAAAAAAAARILLTTPPLGDGSAASSRSTPHLAPSPTDPLVAMTRAAEARLARQLHPAPPTKSRTRDALASQPSPLLSHSLFLSLPPSRSPTPLFAEFALDRPIVWLPRHRVRETLEALADGAASNPSLCLPSSLSFLLACSTQNGADLPQRTFGVVLGLWVPVEVEDDEEGDGEEGGDRQDGGRADGAPAHAATHLAGPASAAANLAVSASKTTSMIRCRRHVAVLCSPHQCQPLLVRIATYVLQKEAARVLRLMDRPGQASSAHPARSLLAHYAETLTLPSPGQLLVVMDGTTKVASFRRPDFAPDDDLITLHATLPHLALPLDAPLLVTLVAATLLETKVVVRATSPHTVSQAVTALSLLLRPFEYQGAIIPCLPPSLAPLLDAPTPLIVGLPYNQPDSVDEGLDDVYCVDGDGWMDDCVLLDLDKGELAKGRQVAGDNWVMPDEGRLLAALQPHFATLLADEVLRESTANAHALSVTMTPRTSAAATGIATCLHSHLVAMLTPVNDALLRETTDAATPTSVFIPDLFIAHFQESHQPPRPSTNAAAAFIEALLSTQLFSEWVEQWIGNVDENRRVEMCGEQGGGDQKERQD